VSYPIDPDWTIDCLNGIGRAVALVTSLVPDPIAINLVTYGEVDDGIYHGTGQTVSEAGFVRFLDVADILGLDETSMRRFAQIRGDFRGAGRKIGDPDVIVAATALHHDLTLVTRNRDHFRRVPDLKIYELG